MIDRELLELAAKAAGIAGSFEGNEEGDIGDGFWINGERTPDNNKHWHPLRNDGDAIRLATKLNMSVEIAEYESSTYAYAGKSPREYACENWGEDKDSATRRAIVRAAAQIGKDMK